jgi:methylated-DNA-[protein]-cysteine S-methyltransferase
MPTNFENKVYEELKNVPKGRVTTYKKLAEKIGTKAYQAVGVALSKNPFAPQVPCHRVVSSNGSIGGFMGKKSGESIEKKINLLEKEGVFISEGKIINFKNIVF